MCALVLPSSRGGVHLTSTWAREGRERSGLAHVPSSREPVARTLQPGAGAGEPRPLEGPGGRILSAASLFLSPGRRQDRRGQTGRRGDPGSSWRADPYESIRSRLKRAAPGGRPARTSSPLQPRCRPPHPRPAAQVATARVPRGCQPIGARARALAPPVDSPLRADPPLRGEDPGLTARASLPRGKAPGCGLCAPASGSSGRSSASPELAPGARRRPAHRPRPARPALYWPVVARRPLVPSGVRGDRTPAPVPRFMSSAEPSRGPAPDRPRPACFSSITQDHRGTRTYTHTRTHELLSFSRNRTRKTHNHIGTQVYTLTFVLVHTHRREGTQPHCETHSH